MKNLRTILCAMGFTTATVVIVVALIIMSSATLVSCDQSYERKGDYLVLYTTDGFSSNYFYCDSAEVISTKEINYWVRGKKTKLLSENITVIPNN
jgi:hypothetical protein